MPMQEHGPSPDAHRGDELDLACRRMLAETMRPCRELPADERQADRAEGRVRDNILAAWYGHGESSHVRAV